MRYLSMGMTNDFAYDRRRANIIHIGTLYSGPVIKGLKMGKKLMEKVFNLIGLSWKRMWKRKKKGG